MTKTLLSAAAALVFALGLGVATPVLAGNNGNDKDVGKADEDHGGGIVCTVAGNPVGNPGQGAKAAFDTSLGQLAKALETTPAALIKSNCDTPDPD